MSQLVMNTHSAIDITSNADEILRYNGRSFHWARQFLGKEAGTKAARLYAFCRLMDDLADGDIENGEARLKTIRDRLAGDTHVSDPALDSFLPFMIEHNLPKRPLRHLIDGLLLDQKHVALRDETELVRYAYYVAGTVGLLMTPLLGCHNRQAHAHALDLGIAMQLTNIARDVLEDAKMGRRYLPASWVGGMSANEICAAAEDPESRDAIIIADAIDRLLALADQYYESGLRGLAALPIRARLAIAVAGSVYRQIGVQLQNHGTNWYAGRTVTSKATKIRVTLMSLPLILRRQLPDWHEAALHAPLLPDMRP